MSAFSKATQVVLPKVNAMMQNKTAAQAAWHDVVKSQDFIMNIQPYPICKFTQYTLN